MTVGLALFSAALFGVGDFLGGTAARRCSLVLVLALSHAVGLAGMLVAAALSGGSPQPRDVLAGMAAGATGGVGVALLYRGLAIGVMSVVAPITAVVAAAVPVAGGLLLGERPGAFAWAGIVVATAAVALLSRGPAGARTTSRGAALCAVGAGLAFGAFYVALSRAGSDAGLWPVVAARVTTVTVFGCVVVAMLVSGRRLVGGGRSGLALIGASGVFDVGANALYLIAVHRGLLSLVAVLVSLYPAGTVACAVVVQRERLGRAQIFGVAAALVGAGLVSAG